MRFCLGNLLKLKVAKGPYQELHPSRVAQDVSRGSLKHMETDPGSLCSYKSESMRLTATDQRAMSFTRRLYTPSGGLQDISCDLVILATVSSYSWFNLGVFFQF